MEENKKTTKSKLRAYLPVIILGIAMVASAIGLGIAAFNKAQKANDTAKDIPFNTEFMTVEEIDQLEDYVDKLTAEEIEALKAEAKKGVKDELTLRLLLLLDDKIEIKVSNNMELIVGMKVNGTKTLTGDASLKMFLGSTKNTMEDAILIVTRGNSLDMDGLVLDGNGVCHAILVQEGATLNYNDGTIQYASSYGIYNQGTATVNGGTLTRCMAAAIGVKAGAKTYVTGGTIKDNYKNHIWAADNSVVEVTGGVFDHSYEHAIYNRGTLTMTGGTIKNSNSANACAVANFGKAYIDGGDDYIEISNCVTGFFSEDDNMEVNKVYGHDIVKNFLRIKDGKGKVTNCKIENTGTYAVRAGGEVTIENIYAENLGTHGIYISPGKVTVKNVEVKNAKEYGFVNVGGEATATDIKITGAGTSAFINYDSTFNGKGEKGLLTLKNCTATDCNSNLLVRGGTSVKVSDCTFNKTKRTNVHMTEGTAELTNVKLLGSTDADCSIVSIRKDAKATFKNVEMAYGNRGISLAGKITVNGGSIHDNKGELAGNAIRTEENAVYHLEGVKIYNNHNTSTKMAGGVGFMAKGSHGTIIDCEITDNTSIRTVGGIYAEEAELNIRNTVFRKNHTSGAEGKGGAILLEKSKSIIRGCTFEGNSTESKYQNVGGAIYSKAGSDLTIKGCTFDSNKSGRGGAIANTGKLTIEADSETKKATIFKNNECTEGGAGVYNGGNGVVTDTGSTYEQNKLTEVHAGGAIRNDGANTQYKLVDATLKENSSKGDGGAIYSNGLVFVATRCTFDGNLAEQGGAAYINTTNAAKNPVEANGNGFALSATDCVFVNNKSVEKKENTLGGGALYFTGTGKAIVQNKNYESAEANKYDNAYFKGNHAEVEGGAIVVGGNVDLTLRGYKFAENTSNLNSAAIYVKGKLTDLNGYYYKNTVTNEKADTAKGGAIQCHLYQSLAEAKFTNTVFEENSTPGDGGAIYNNGKSVTLKDCKLLNNVARQGGAIYNKKAATFVNVAIDEAAYKGDAGSCVYVAKGGTLSLDNLAMSNIGTNKNSHAIYNDGGKIVAASGAKKTVTIDKVAGHGIVNTNEGTVKLSNVAITDVTTENRDGIYVVSGEVAVTDAAIQNVARDGVYVKGGTVTIEDTTLGNIKRAAITATDTANELGKQTAVSNVTLKNVTVKLPEGAKEDARAAQNGIYCVRGNVSVDNVNISNTGSTKDDHAVLNDGGTIKSVEGASKTITIADTTGHGIANINEGTVNLSNVAISDVSTEKRDGIYANSGKVEVTDAQIENVARGAIYSVGGTIIANNVTVKNASYGAYAEKTGVVTLNGATIDGAKVNGICNVGATVNVAEVTLKNTGTDKDSHTVFNNGGTIKSVAGASKTITITDATGHGIANINGGTVNLTGVSIAGVTTESRDGIYADSGNVTVINAVIQNIKRDGVYAKGGIVTIEETTLENIKRAAVTSTEAGEVTLKNVDVKLPEGAQEGARSAQYGIYCVRGKVNVNNVNISNTGSTGDDHAVLNNGGTINTATGATKTITITDAPGHGIANISGGTTNLVGVSVTDVAKDGVYSNDGEVTVEGLTVNKKDNAVSSRYGVHATGEKAVIYLSSATVNDTSSHGLYAEKAGSLGSSTQRISDVSINNAGDRGVMNDGGTLFGEKVTVNSSKHRAFDFNNSANADVNGLYVNATKSNQGVSIQNKSVATITGFSINNTNTAAVYIVNSGTVVMQDSAAGVKGTINKAGSYGIYVKNNNKDTVVTIDGVKISEAGKYGLGSLDVGPVAAKNVEIENAKTAGVQTSTNATIETDNVIINGGPIGIEAKGGTIQKVAGVQNGVTISNPTQYGIKHVSGTTTVKNVAVTGATTAGVYIEGGTLKTEAIAVNGGKDGIVAVGGTIESVTAGIKGIVATNTRYGINHSSGTVTVKDVTISGGTCGILNGGGALSIARTDISESAKYGILNNNGTLNLDTVTVNGILSGSADASGIRLAKGTVNAKNVDVTNSTRAGIRTEAGTIFNVDAVEITGGPVGLETLGGTVQLAENATSGVSVTGTTYGIKHLEKDAIVKNVAIANATTAGIYMEAGNLKTESITINGGKHGIEGVDGTIESATSGVKGVTISVPNYGINHSTGTLTVKDVIISGGTCGALNGGGTLNVANTDIDGSTKYGVLNNSGTIALDTVAIANIADGAENSAGIRIAGGTAGTAEQPLKNISIQNCTKQGLRQEGGTVYVETISIKGATDAIYLNHSATTGTLNAKNATIEDVTRGIAIAKGKVIAENVTVQKSTDANGKKPQSGVFVHGANSVAEVKSVIVKNATVAGINLQNNGTVIANNVTVDSCDLSVYTTNGTLQKADGATTAVTVIPANYVVNEEIVEGATGTESIVESISALILIQQDPNSPDTTWFVNSAGKLGKTVSNAEAKIGDNEYATLQEALEVATATEGTTVVLMKDATLSEPIVVTKNLTLTSDRAVTITRADALDGEAKSSLITVTSGKLSVVGADGKEITINGNASAEKNECIRAIKVAEGAELHMEYATIQDFYTSNSFGEGGTAIYNEGTTTLVHVNLTNNQTGTSSAGGAVCNQAGTFTISDSTVSACSTNGSGGAIYAANGASTTITSCEFNNNNAGINTDEPVSEGGALYFNGTSKFEVNNCTFTENTAEKGGAIAVKSATINGATFTDNTATVANDILLKDAASSITVSGAFVGATVVYSGENAGIKVAGEVTGDITILPHSYTPGTQLVQKSSDAVSNDVYASGLSVIKVAENNGDVWFLNGEGKLTKAVAQLVGTGEYYTSLKSAISAAQTRDGADEIKIFADDTINSAISITSEITFTPTKAVTITAADSITGNLFKVESAGTLKMLATETNTITLQGTTATNSLIYNSGSATLQNLVMKSGKMGLVNYKGTMIATNISISGCTGNGIKVADSTSDVTLDNISVLNVRNTQDSHGVLIESGTVKVLGNSGLSVENTQGHGIAITGGSFTASVVKVKDATRAGIYVSAANVTISTVNEITCKTTVSGTKAHVAIKNATVSINGTPISNYSGTAYYELSSFRQN